jgi:hypothetical protein
MLGRNAIPNVINIIDTLAFRIRHELKEATLENNPFILLSR